MPQAAARTTSRRDPSANQSASARSAAIAIAETTETTLIVRTASCAAESWSECMIVIDAPSAGTPVPWIPSS
ncbi:MAG TPA: hypothetical protein VL422_06590 [Miltoncostaea sp.]|nr:hypothetical protein [Miltoncostaea sp.]